MPRIPNAEVVNVRSLAGLVWGRESGDNNPVPYHNREGLDVGILRRGACLTAMEFPSYHEKVMRESLRKSGKGTPSHFHPWVVEDSRQ